jgi:phenylpyruvate tautomerase PptA (4-oxalocrotonate tautomerase family)
MSQIKIYGLKSQMAPIRDRLSDTLHDCIVEAFQYPENKRAHRFFYMDTEDFFFPEGRTDKYTIIEIILFEGRTVATKKNLYRLIFERFKTRLNIEVNDVEIILIETPVHDWGIRGYPADELSFDYKIAV